MHVLEEIKIFGFLVWNELDAMKRKKFGKK